MRIYEICLLILKVKCVSFWSNDALSSYASTDLRPVARWLRSALDLLDRVLPGVWVLPGHQHRLETAHEPCRNTHKHIQIESRAVKQQSQKASHGQRWAWPGSRPGRQLRANRRQCTRSHQRRWSGGPRPGWGPRCYWPGCPLSPHGSPCRRSMPAPRRPSLSDTWTCKQAVPLSVLKWRSWMINLHLLSSCYRMFSFLIRLLSAKPQWWKSWRHRLVSGYLSLQNSLWNFVKSPQMSATQTCWVIKMRGHVSTGTNLSDIR